MSGQKEWRGRIVGDRFASLKATERKVRSEGKEDFICFKIVGRVHN